MATKLKRPDPSGFVKNPTYSVTMSRCPAQIRAEIAGERIVDSRNAMFLIETGHQPVHYFPRNEVRMEFLERTEHETICPYKGVASYWSIRTGGRLAENAAWTYEDPYDEVIGIKDYVALYWHLMDHWYEGEEEIFDGPRLTAGT